MGEENIDEVVLDFFTDASLSALERWLTAKECTPPEQVVERLHTLVQRSTAALLEEAGQNRATQENK